MIDPRIAYYTRDEDHLNFGDYLSEYLMHVALIAPFVEADVYRLIGSTIHDSLIEADRRQTGRADAEIVYWCCGMRDAASISPSLRDYCQFFGVRGPLTRDALALPVDTPMGDPGLLLPILYEPRSSERTAGKTVCIPHFSERAHAEALRAQCGADMALSAAITSNADLLALIDDIVSADFIFTGSLHGAILACAYDIPFAHWDTGFVDIPFKWADFAASIGVDIEFHQTVSEGRAAYRLIQDRIAKPKLAPILGCCPFSVRPSILLRALAADAGTTASTSPGGWFIDELAFDRDVTVRDVQARDLLRRAKQSKRGQTVPTGHVADELAAVATQAMRLANIFHLRARAFSLHVSPESSRWPLAEGYPATAFLGSGWSEPNHVAPWSIGEQSRLSIPPGLGWEQATALGFEGYALVPHAAPHNGRRRIWIWMNGVLVTDEALTNASEFDTTSFGLTTTIPKRLRNGEGPLDILIAMEPAGSLLSLGAGDDPRPIGIAPVSLVWKFATT